MRTHHLKIVVVIVAVSTVASSLFYWAVRPKPRDLDTITADYHARAARLAAELASTAAKRPEKLRDQLNAHISMWKILDELATYGSMAKPAVPIVVTLCEHDDLGVRYRAYHALGRVEDERGLEPLLDALSNKRRVDRNEMCRVGEAFTMFRDPNSLMPLLRTSADNISPEVPVAALLASVRIVNEHPDVLIEAIRHEDPEIRRWAVNFLRDMSIRNYLWPETHDYLMTNLKPLAANETSPAYRALIRRPNYIEGDRNGDLLKEARADPSALDGESISRLVQINGDGAIGALVEALDRVPRDRLDAVVRALAYLRAEEAVDALIGLLESNDPGIWSSRNGPEQRKRVVNALWDITGENYGEIAEAWRAWYREHR